jgi:hypothetical protein
MWPCSPRTPSLPAGPRSLHVSPVNRTRPAAVVRQRRRPRPPIRGRCRPPEPISVTAGPPSPLLPAAPPPYKRVLPPTAGRNPPHPPRRAFHPAQTQRPRPLASTSSRRTAPYGTAILPEPPSTRTPPRRILFTTPPPPDLLGEPHFRSLCPAQPPLSGDAGAKHSRCASSARPSWAGFTRAQQAAMPARAGRFRPCAASRGPI